jgi:AraC family transcriptional regulator of adaptative response / DNA-3-methyladenine glycosylase II
MAASSLDSLDRNVCYQALLARDPRFDGRFFTAVVSTGIYCRPVCPARPPKLENCLFLPSAAAAHALGFRPCLRCRPEVAPGLAGWRGSASTVSRALGLIAEGALDRAGMEGLADRLGVGTRHLRRLFARYLGASPVAVAQVYRVLFAKRLIAETSLAMTEVALASGFGSVRRFNHAMTRTYGRTPTSLRRAAQRSVAASRGLSLKLAFRPPYDWRAMIEFLSARAIPGVEACANDCYRRTFAIDAAKGFVEVRPAPGRHYLVASIHTTDVSVLGGMVARVRRLFDLDADMARIDGHLAKDPRLAARIRERPGVRVPGAWDNFELAVRAVLGQQIRVTAATTLAGRLAAAYGARLNAAGSVDPGVSLLFPTPAAIAQADLTSIGLTRARSDTLRALATAFGRDPGWLDACSTLEHAVDALRAIPGVGPWTAQYIAMRALGEPDAFPASDLGLLRAVGRDDRSVSPSSLAEIAKVWQPWRAYAALRLWTQG